MLFLPDAWVWDSWYVDDGEVFHAFYLKASRALGDPERRHAGPIVGHSVSPDLHTWTELADAFAPSEPGAFDDQGIWTGSVVKGDDGRWHLFYTGIARENGTRQQRIGHALSDDLMQWTRVTSNPVAVADGRWYETLETCGEENWRDPWVVREGEHWRMLVTAHARIGHSGEKACVATASSPDLVTWTVEAPLAEDVGMSQMEVFQTVEIDGQFVVAFCLRDVDVHAPGLLRRTGTWTAPADSLTGPFHFDLAEPLDVEGNYAGRFVRGRDGSWNLMAFVDVDATGAFAGGLGNPVPVGLTPRGTLQPVCDNATVRFRGLAA